MLGPRVVIGGTHSGVGKTTVATGLMAALHRRGRRVAAAKVGPDFIDPGYHRLATGRPGRNLDAWICGPEAVPRLAARAAAGSDVLVVEGVMGLFDGAAGDGDLASTAHVARLLDAPVLLVVDASATSRSIAATVHGFTHFDARVRVAGVVVNRVGSAVHESMVRDALGSLGVPVVGVLHREDALTWRDRHLGLVPVVEQRPAVERSLDRLAERIEERVDLPAVARVAASAPDTPCDEPAVPDRTGRARVAVAGGPAFSFVYPDNLEALESAGAELVDFDPLEASRLPDAEGLYVGGGFPEVFVDALAANRALLEDVRHRVGSGLVTLAECGGLLWLCRALDNRTLAGVVPAIARMSERLTLGYRAAVTRASTPVAPAGTSLRGHEFHYSTVHPPGEALALSGHSGSGLAGFATPHLLASYLHLHFGGDPSPAARFVAAAAAAR